MMGRSQETDELRVEMSMLTALVLILLSSCFLYVRPVSGDESRPCSEDIANFCKDVRPGGGRLISCLKGHQADLTPVCKVKLEEVQERLKRAKQDCAADIARFCKDVKEGEGRIARCLDANAAALSPVCAAHLEWAKSKAKER